MRPTNRKKEPVKLYGKIAIMCLVDVARCDPRLTHGDTVILQAIGSRVNKETIGLRTQTAIAEEMGVSHTTIGKHEKRLIKYGYITKRRRTERGHRNKFVYKFNTEIFEPYGKNSRTLTRFRKMIEIEMAAKSETPNSFKQRNPKRFRRSEPSNDLTRIRLKKESEKAATKGEFKSLGDVSTTVVLGLAGGS